MTATLLDQNAVFVLHAPVHALAHLYVYYKPNKRVHSPCGLVTLERGVEVVSV